MKINNKRLFRTVMALVIALAISVVFVGCNDILDNIENVKVAEGTYYKGSDGAVCDEWIKISSENKWSDNENVSGYFAVNVNIVRFYDSNDELYTVGMVDGNAIKFFSSEDFSDIEKIIATYTLNPNSEKNNPAANPNPLTIDDIPEYNGKAYVAIRNNVPDFSADEMVTDSFEFYSALDSLGRCGYTVACVGTDIMPTEERDSIGMVKPTGWQTVKYDIVSGKYLYNRCHLIGFQLTGENANERNLITGTRYLNIDGMLEFENMVADYVKETGNHVLYRVTPLFVENELVARGVHMEALSVEDDGEGICFNVFAYNVQPGITIDYATGNSRLSE